MKKNISRFQRDVYNAVKSVPTGFVATYAQIALMSGHRGAARAVGNALHVNPFPGEVPCHRVVNSRGMLAPDFAFGGIDEQAKRLESEGVEVKEHCVDLERFQYRG